jgi:hypothetical protein
VYLFAFLDDHSRLAVGYRFGFAEDTVRLAVALKPALSSRGVPESVYVDNGSAFVDEWLLRGCAKLGIRLIHSTPHRPQGRGKIERFFRTVREQFLVEVADTSAADLADQHISPAEALLQLNSHFTAWCETVYHRRVHTETSQTPLARWQEGWERLGHGPSMASADALTEAFLWSAHRVVTKSATISLHGNVYQVESALVGRKVDLVFSPFNLDRIEVRYRDRSYGLAVPFHITRHTHPKATPETPEPAPSRTGISYLDLVAQAHQQYLATEPQTSFQALYPAEDTPIPALTIPALAIPDLATPDLDTPEELGGATRSVAPERVTGDETAREARR